VDDANSLKAVSAGTIDSGADNPVQHHAFPHLKGRVFSWLEIPIQETLRI
jgi:hypothetical protein